MHRSLSTLRPRLFRAALVPLVLSLVLAVSGGTAGAACPPDTVPSGNSEVDQYVETIPGSCGDRSGSGEGTDKTNTDASGADGSIPASTADELASLGADGAAAASLADATSTGGSPRSGRSASSSVGASDSRGDDAAPAAMSGSDGSAVAAITKSLSGDGDGGIGPMLPVAMVAVALLAIVGGVLKRRADAPPS